jgi:hypothetical protein
MFIIGTTFFSILINHAQRSALYSFKVASRSCSTLLQADSGRYGSVRSIDHQVGTINGADKAGDGRIIITDKLPFAVDLTVIRIWKGTGSGCIIYRPRHRYRSAAL